MKLYFPVPFGNDTMFPQVLFAQGGGRRVERQADRQTERERERTRQRQSDGKNERNIKRKQQALWETIHSFLNVNACTWEARRNLQHFVTYFSSDFSFVGFPAPPCLDISQIWDCENVLAATYMAARHRQYYSGSWIMRAHTPRRHQLLFCGLYFFFPFIWYISPQKNWNLKSSFSNVVVDVDTLGLEGGWE